MHKCSASHTQLCRHANGVYNCQHSQTAGFHTSMQCCMTCNCGTSIADGASCGSNLDKPMCSPQHALPVQRVNYVHMEAFEQVKHASASNCTAHGVVMLWGSSPSPAARSLGIAPRTWHAQLAGCFWRLGLPAWYCCLLNQGGRTPTARASTLAASSSTIMSMNDTPHKQRIPRTHGAAAVDALHGSTSCGKGYA